MSTEIDHLRQRVSDLEHLVTIIASHYGWQIINERIPELRADFEKYRDRVADQVDRDRDE